MLAVAVHLVVLAVVGTAVLLRYTMAALQGC